MRILHVLDHSIPLHSGYTFRTLAILREQQRLGWQTLQLTRRMQGAGTADEKLVNDYQSGARNCSAPLWTLLKFEVFLRISAEGRSAGPAFRGEDVTHA